MWIYHSIHESDLLHSFPNHDFFASIYSNLYYKSPYSPNITIYIMVQIN
jgi:ssDNA-specific exonuclease RecJ